MKNYVYYVLVLFFGFLNNVLIAQEKEPDLRYLEDQIFLSVTYNSIINHTTDISQGGFSNGWEIGYMRDIPFNKQRNIGIGVGINYASSHIYQNIGIFTYPTTGESYLKILNKNDYIRNKLTISTLEIPIELRYRTSTPNQSNFFRIYLGMKLGVIIDQYSKTTTNVSEIAYYNAHEIQLLRYGPTLTLGYGAWNLRMYYGLSKLFANNTYTTKIPGETIDPISLNTNELNIGLIFFII
ncbi:MAG: PorT family protein [Ichthyobacteriaceae bacterium]|nr:PorT family protein [Ichthyobacteriaceae bacterium]